MERIQIASIWYRDLPLIMPEVLKIRGVNPYNIEEGIVFSGWRHPNAMYPMIAVTGKRSVSSEVGYYVQGFLTNKNRFVDRKEAWTIAAKAKQIIDRKTGEPRIVPEDSIGRLFSEDIY